MPRKRFNAKETIQKLREVAVHLSQGRNVSEAELDKAHPARGSLGKLLSPTKRRRAVEHVRETLGPDCISELRACRVFGQSRSTQCRARHVPEDKPCLIRRIIDLVTRYVRYEYCRITMMLSEEGWGVQHKRIERLWRQEDFKVRGEQPQRRRLCLNEGS